jgi:hypothetical protein
MFLHKSKFFSSGIYVKFFSSGIYVYLTVQGMFVKITAKLEESGNITEIEISVHKQSHLGYNIVYCTIALRS